MNALATFPRSTPTAAVPQPSGAELARRLADACVDYALKQHLADAEALGRSPTADELAIHVASAAARDAALPDLISWRPATWREFADKSEGLHQAAVTGSTAPDAGLAELLTDLQLLAGDRSALPESAIPILAREVERRREEPAGTLEGDDAPRMELFFLSHLLLLKAPCTTLASAAAKVRAVLDPTIGLEATGGGADDPPCLWQALAVLEREAGPTTSPLAEHRAESLRLRAAAEPMGYAAEEDGDDWLGMPLVYRAEAIADRVHLAPCTDRADALAKLDMALLDVEDVSDLEALAPALTFTLRSLRAWLAEEPQPVSTAVATRAEHRGMPEVDRQVAQA